MVQFSRNSGCPTRHTSLQVTCELVVVVGDPREEIPDFIAKHPVDMVVVGSRGLGTVSR